MKGVVPSLARVVDLAHFFFLRKIDSPLEAVLSSTSLYII